MSLLELMFAQIFQQIDQNRILLGVRMFPIDIDPRNERLRRLKLPGLDPIDLDQILAFHALITGCDWAPFDAHLSSTSFHIRVRILPVRGAKHTENIVETHPRAFSGFMEDTRLYPITVAFVRAVLTRVDRMIVADRYVDITECHHLDARTKEDSFIIDVVPLRFLGPRAQPQTGQNGVKHDHRPF